VRVRKTILIGAWIVVGTNLLLAFGAIALLTRMSPAIATILEQNDVSVEACQQMLAVLAAPTEEGAVEARGARFEEAVRNAELNITDARERAVLDVIRAEADGALRGDAAATTRVIDAVQTLAGINREAMREADLQAMRLGTAGAWSVVLLALVSFLFSLIFIHRLNAQLLAPVAELREVLQSFQRGDVYRRCSTEGSPPELRILMQGVNDLLDRVHAEQPRRLPEPPSGRGVRIE
jgi:hypothetical protein